MTKKLLETILTSEFTFGFEFEAYVDEETLKKYSDDPDYDADDNEGPLYDSASFIAFSASLNIAFVFLELAPISL